VPYSIMIRGAKAYYHFFFSVKSMVHAICGILYSLEEKLITNKCVG